LRLAEHVAEARALFPADREFGAWWDAQGFGLNEKDRQALAQMGRDLERARDVLASTERRSIQHVYKNEFARLDHAIQPPPPPAPASKPERPKKKDSLDAPQLAERDRLDLSSRPERPRLAESARDRSGDEFPPEGGAIEGGALLDQAGVKARDP
jgi:hypothetical protein